MDSGWQKRSSGTSYNSNSSHCLIVGGETKLVLGFEVFSKCCARCDFKIHPEYNNESSSDDDSSVSSNSTFVDSSDDDQSDDDEIDDEIEDEANNNEIDDEVIDDEEMMMIDDNVIFVQPTEEEKEEANQQSKVSQRKVNEKKEHQFKQVIDPYVPLHPSCPKNFNGSSKAMEPWGAVVLTTCLYRKGSLYVHTVITDDDSTTRAALHHSLQDKVEKGMLSVLDWPRIVNKKKT